MKCKYGNARCLCQNCIRNALYEHCTSGYCIDCIECEDAGKSVHDVYICTGNEQIEEGEI